MPKNRSNYDSDFIISETGNWNVADMFSKIKIMKPLANCDIYEDIAIYGYDSFLEELVNYEIPIDELRFRGLKRLINELIKLAKNGRFAMKRDKTKEDLKKFEKALTEIRDNLLPNTCRYSTNQSQGIRRLVIDDKVFNGTLEIVKEIKALMNTPLNRNHLIFTDREEFDPTVFKKKIKDRIINEG